jgi:hypothetical protein
MENRPPSRLPSEGRIVTVSAEPMKGVSDPCSVWTPFAVTRRKGTA